MCGKTLNCKAQIPVLPTGDDFDVLCELLNLTCSTVCVGKSSVLYGTGKIIYSFHCISALRTTSTIDLNQIILVGKNFTVKSGNIVLSINIITSLTTFLASPVLVNMRDIEIL
jgi:hypothetical protein